jgi:DNA-binding NtrC family response regulator
MACILIVDDEKNLLRLISKVLADRYEVLSASSPHTALEIVRSKPRIDLVISDVEMPEMLGPDLLAEVHKLSPLTSGLLMTGNASFALELSNTPVLSKPFSPNELYAAVTAALSAPHLQSNPANTTTITDWMGL